MSIGRVTAIVAAVIGIGLLVAVLAIGMPSSFWTPGGGELVEAFLAAGFAFCVGWALAAQGLGGAGRHADVETGKADAAFYAETAAFLVGLAGVIGAIVLVGRYVYLAVAVPSALAPPPALSAHWLPDKSRSSQVAAFAHEWALADAAAPPYRPAVLRMDPDEVRFYTIDGKTYAMAEGVLDARERGSGAAGKLKSLARVSVDPARQTLVVEGLGEDAAEADAAQGRVAGAAGTCGDDRAFCLTAKPDDLAAYVASKEFASRSTYRFQAPIRTAQYRVEGQKFLWALCGSQIEEAWNLLPEATRKEYTREKLKGFVRGLHEGAGELIVVKYQSERIEQEGGPTLVLTYRVDYRDSLGYVSVKFRFTGLKGYIAALARESL